MENKVYTDLKEIIKLVQKGDLLLPDFQRGFVWTHDKQQRLIASVLTKMPVGSILILEADRSDYGCRILGRKDEPIMKTEGNAYMLLDGQQRMTVLANVFSNLLFYDYESGDSLISDYTRLVSTDLRNRFFLRIPTVSTLTAENDLFHLKDLYFPMENPEATESKPDFLTGDILRYIVCIPFDKTTEEPYAPHTKNPQSIGRYCIQEDGYKIPLYLLINNRIGDSSNETRLKNILKDIVTEVVRYRLENEYDILKTFEERKSFIEKNIMQDYWEDILENGEAAEMRRALEEKWISMGVAHWADHMREYLTSCISHLDLHQIAVANSDRSRAIDIYENLNIGGVTLSAFELVLAKAAKKKLPNNKNLFDQIVTHIQTPRKYEEDVLSDQIRKYFNEYISENEYSAAENMGCYDEKKNQLNKKYTEAFLNILSLCCNVKDYQSTAIELSMIKREKIMDISSDDIVGNYKKVCDGIDRACYFLQVRCGIRKIQEVHYKLMLVLLGYIYSNDEFYHNKEVTGLLEAWYWLAIFSGRYDKDQNEHIISDIRHMLKWIGGEKDDWFGEMKDRLFHMQGFSDEATLLMKTSVVPKKVIRETICQFYLAMTYKDLMTEERLHIFCNSADTLEEHHIVPIGMPCQDTYKKMLSVNRKDKTSIFNSPLNFVYITKESNRKISNHPLEYYVKHCNTEAIYKLHITDMEVEKLTNEKLQEALKGRLASIQTSVKERIGNFI